MRISTRVLRSIDRWALFLLVRFSDICPGRIIHKNVVWDEHN